MKKFLSYTLLLAAGMIMFISCKKQADIVAAFGTTEDQAFVRVIHASPSFRQVFNAPDSFNIFVNNVKVNGPLITYAGLFPASNSTAFGYIAVPQGLVNVKLTVAGTVNTDSIPLTLFSKIFTKGQYYSIIVTDNFKSTTDSSKIILQDNYTKPSNGNYSIRFVHAVLNDTAGLAIDVFSARRNANIFNAIKPGQIVNFQTFPYNSQVSDTFYVRRAGTLQNLAVSIATPGFLGNQRVYTFIYRGNGDLTTGTKARVLAPYLHQ